MALKVVVRGLEYSEEDFEALYCEILDLTVYGKPVDEAINRFADQHRIL